MTKEEVVKILRNAYCTDACECVFDLYDFDENHEGICKATDPPMSPWENCYICPFCKMIADMLEKVM